MLTNTKKRIKNYLDEKPLKERAEKQLRKLKRRIKHYKRKIILNLFKFHNWCQEEWSNPQFFSDNRPKNEEPIEKEIVGVPPIVLAYMFIKRNIIKGICKLKTINPKSFIIGLQSRYIKLRTNRYKKQCSKKTVWKLNGSAARYYVRQLQEKVDEQTERITDLELTLAKYLGTPYLADLRPEEISEETKELLIEVF